MKRALLFALEVFSAFVNECVHAFLLVCRGEAEGEYFVFVSDTGDDVAVDAAVDSRLSELYSDRSVAHDFFRYLFAGIHQFFLRNDFVDQADAMSFLSVDHVSAENHFFAIAAAYDTGETLSAAEARCDAEANFRLTEFSVFSSITEVASAGEFAAAAESVAVNSCNDRRPS